MEINLTRTDLGIIAATLATVLRDCQDVGDELGACRLASIIRKCEDARVRADEAETSEAAARFPWAAQVARMAAKFAVDAGPGPLPSECGRDLTRADLDAMLDGDLGPKGRR